MANHVIYTRKDGTEIKLKITSRRVIDLETRLGDSIQNKLAETDKLSVASEFIAAALPDNDYNVRKETALDIYDEMTECGKTLKDYLELVQDTLVAAGFMDAAVLERQKKATAAQEKLAQLVHEAEMRRMEKSSERISGMYTEPETQEEKAEPEIVLPTLGSPLTIPTNGAASQT